MHHFLAFVLSLALSLCSALSATAQFEALHSPFAFRHSAFDVEVAFPDLTFQRPVDLQHAGDGSGRLFVVEQHTGRIRVFPNDTNASSSQVFLDLDGLNTNNEEGLLGLAFHPDYENNGYFFVYYSAPNPRRSVVARYTVDAANPNQADPTSEVVFLTINQPYANHNGGQLAFGPNDGYLYIGLGDGGDAGDPDENGQDPRTLLGSILRIDVDTATPGGPPYSIPPDNPFAGNTDGNREEIYAYGFRNPWRFSFDPVTADLWIGDVGQSRLEEIDLVEKGGNYGWNTMEASLCYDPETGCSQEGLILPIWEYGRDLGISVTGGYVYRGIRVPELMGKYIYADYSSGRIWALSNDGVNPPVNEDVADVSFNVPAFGVSENQELFILGFDGKIHRFVETRPTGSKDPSGLPGHRGALNATYPNPFQFRTTIPFTLAAEGQVLLEVFDVQGRRLRTLVDVRRLPGDFNAHWDGKDDVGQPAPAGVYFVKLNIDDITVGLRSVTLVR